MTYLDMVLRGRPASSTPEQTVQRAEELAHVSLSTGGGDPAAADNRRAGLGALLGIVTGAGLGAVYAAVRRRLGSGVPAPLLGVLAGLGASVATAAPMTALGVTDPRRWSAGSWLADLVPHLAYGAVTAAVFEGLRRR